MTGRTQKSLTHAAALSPSGPPPLLTGSLLLTRQPRGAAGKWVPLLPSRLLPTSRLTTGSRERLQKGQGCPCLGCSEDLDRYSLRRRWASPPPTPLSQDLAVYLDALIASLVFTSLWSQFGVHQGELLTCRELVES